MSNPLLFSAVPIKAKYTLGSTADTNTLLYVTACDIIMLYSGRWTVMHDNSVGIQHLLLNVHNCMCE